MSEKKGAFIVIDGVDQAGKSTQAYLLVKHLSAGKIRVLPVREPGGTDIGERVREILLDPHGTEITPECELLLYMASRAQLVGEVVKPALARGYVVVSERYICSSLAYQGYAGGMARQDIEAIGKVATAGLEPDLTVILDIDPEVAAEREKTPGETDRIEKKGVEFQKLVRKGFLDIAASHEGRIVVVDGSQPPKAVHEEIKRLVAGVI